MQEPIAPSETTATPLSSRPASTISGSISYNEEEIIAANLNRKSKKWLPWRLNWFNKGQKRPAVDENDDGAISPSLSRDGSASSKTRKSPNQLAPPEEEDENERATQDIASRLASLREVMTTEQVNVYIVPSHDSHISDFVAPKDKRLKWISGFTGFSGLGVITQTEAVLFTDSRFWVQASRELDSSWKLHRVGLDEGDWLDFIQAQSTDLRIGIDPRHVSHRIAIDLRERIRSTNSKLVFPERNLIDAVWRGRPHRSKEAIFIHPPELSGFPASNKLNLVKDWIRLQASEIPHSKDEEKPSAALFASLSEIAWTLNLRGNDIPFNPVFYSYLLVTLDTTVLFVEAAKLQDDVSAYLSELGVKTEDYDNIWNFLRSKKWGNGKVLMPDSTPYVVSLLISSTRYIIIPSIVEELKALKNEIELRGLEQAYVRDGAVLVRWLAWLEERIRRGPAISEYEAAMRLSEFHQHGENFAGLAYETRSAYGPNSAMPFYTPRRSGSSMIEKRLPYLIDSSCQFLDGTCSTTRTLHFGPPTNEQRDAFTRVLQGHIAIDSAIFPEGTTGGQLDVLAKRELWAGGLDYLQPTGNGIGSFLSVLEGPQALAVGNNIPLRPGHVLINEPGFYREGSFGIRIGSALVVTRIQLNNTFGDSHDSGTWLGFRRLTRVPIQTRMLLPNLLSERERFWIKEHNMNCLKVLGPLLKDDKQALVWLQKQTDPRI